MELEMTEVDEVTSSARTKSELAELVQRYQVCWEVWPEYFSVGPTMTKVGFELELSGSDKGITFNPTCRECSQIHWALEAIASWILDQRDVELTLELRHRDQSISYSGARRNRPDVTLAISILHRSGSSDPVDLHEIHYLEKMKTQLRQLGARERQWTRNSYHPTEALAAA